MHLDITDVMPFDMGRYLVMWFVSGGVIMACCWIGELFARKEGPILVGLASAGLVIWHYSYLDGLRLPLF
jgi:hypothetical protein